MKKTISCLFLFGALSANAIELEMLSGDTKLACEAMLCLASPTKPSEWSPSLSRYFSIDAKKWKDVVAKRKSFLNLCPVDSSSDPEMYNYKNNILVNLDGECSTAALNQRIEKVVLRTEKRCDPNGDNCYTIYHYGYRINPQLTNSCKLLASSKYTDYRLKYTCDTRYYTQAEWDRGSTLQEVSMDIYNALPISQREQGEKLTQISRAEFYRLPANQRKIINNQFYRVSIAYYQKNSINKQCWINEE